MKRKELKQRILCRDLGRCRHENCFEKNNLQLAHRIADTESNIKEIQYILKGVFGDSLSRKWVRENIIDHPFNVVTACERHNDYFNIGFNDGKKMEVLFAITQDLMGA